MADPVQPLLIGQDGSGEIADVRVMVDGSLPPEEITQLSSGRWPEARRAELAGYWMSNEGLGTTLADASGSGRHATFDGAWADSLTGTPELAGQPVPDYWGTGTTEVTMIAPSIGFVCRNPVTDVVDVADSGLDHSRPDHHGAADHSTDEQYEREGVGADP